jgi:hypothetical protein
MAAEVGECGGLWEEEEEEEEDEKDGSSERIARDESKTPR